MILRKLNAWLSFVTTLLFLNHAIFKAVWMLSRGRVVKNVNCASLVMFMLMIIHAFISILLAFLGHKGVEKRKCNGYLNMNKPTYIQRASGMLLIILTILHIAGTVGIMQPPQLVHAILPPIFFLICMVHVAISTNKAFITLGIGSAKFIKIADVAIKAICVITLIADIIGFYLYVV